MRRLLKVAAEVAEWTDSGRLLFLLNQWCIAMGGDGDVSNIQYSFNSIQYIESTQYSALFIYGRDTL